MLDDAFAILRRFSFAFVHFYRRKYSFVTVFSPSFLDFKTEWLRHGWFPSYAISFELCQTVLFWHMSVKRRLSTTLFFWKIHWIYIWCVIRLNWMISASHYHLFEWIYTVTVALCLRKMNASWWWKKKEKTHRSLFHFHIVAVKNSILNTHVCARWHTHSQNCSYKAADMNEILYKNYGRIFAHYHDFSHFVM